MTTVNGGYLYRGSDTLAVRGMPGEFHARVESAEGLLHPRPPAEHRCLACHYAAVHLLRSGHERRRHIAAADVLTQRRLDLLTEIGWRLFSHCCGRTATRGSGLPCT